ncbi:MAG TPA: TetR/AcrR family transcriptional regulator [Steroidobacteraceae bacterium]|jgi:AcrR family transcriptional regulator
MPETLEPAELDESTRRKRTVRAAEELFKKIGFRAVTMELVAREANIAKATLYSYFKNKDELYVEVSARLARMMKNGVEAALAKPDTPLDQRLIEAVLSKHRLVFGLVRKSPHATELMSYTHTVAGHVWTDLDRDILALLATALRSDPEFAPRAEELARALYSGSGGIAMSCETDKQMEAELSTFVSAQLAGSRVLAKTAGIS